MATPPRDISRTSQEVPPISMEIRLPVSLRGTSEASIALL
jgi:hypothetical protein